MKILKSILNKLISYFLHTEEPNIRFNSPLDIAVPPIEIDFIYFELSTELSELVRLDNSPTTK